MKLEFEESAANAILEEGPGDGSEDTNQGDGKEDGCGFVFLVVFGESLGSSVTDRKDDDSNQHQKQVFHGKVTKRSGFHHNFGVAGKLRKPGAHEVQSEAQEKLCVDRNQREQVELLVSGRPGFVAFPAHPGLDCRKDQQHKNYPAQPGVNVQNSSMH